MTKNKKNKIALVTGITGQDGAYLTEFLLQKGYIVHGLKRRTSLFNTARIDHLFKDPHLESSKLFLHYSDMTDSMSLTNLINKIQPDEIYNLAAMSHVHVSFDVPEYVANADGVGTLRLLEAVRFLGLANKTKIYQASTSEFYGKVHDIPQSEKTPFYPSCPYAVAKLYAYWISVNYREAYDMFVSNGILFNHVSPIRGESFVTRKITRAACKIVLGLQKTLYLGNLDAKRDWGHAKDYVEVMWKILQYKNPDDWVIATGITTTVRDFVIMAFEYLGIELEFKGSNDKEYALVKRVKNNQYDLKKGQVVLRVDPEYYRPTEVDILVGDASKANKKLDWKPKYSLSNIVEDMIESDLKIMKKDLFLKDAGYQILNEHE